MDLLPYLGRGDYSGQEILVLHCFPFRREPTQLLRVCLSSTRSNSYYLCKRKRFGDLCPLIIPRLLPAQKWNRACLASIEEAGHDLLNS